MAEQIIKSFDDVKSIRGVTKMTQANWQAYFGALLPNGVYDGLQVTTQNDTGFPYANTKRNVTDGCVMANGILATLKTTTDYTDIGDLENGTINDRFVCVRVYFGSERADIVVKTDITNGSDYITTAKAFVNNESYQCTRNETYWDIPLFYQSGPNTDYAHGLSLRRPVNLSGRYESNPDIAGMDSASNMLISGSYPRQYNISVADSSDVEKSFYVDPVNLPNGAIFRFHIETSGDKILKLRSPFFTNNFGHGEIYVTNPDYTYITYVGDVENWISDTTYGCYKTYLEDEDYAFRFTRIGSNFFGHIILVEKLCGGAYDND